MDLNFISGITKLHTSISSASGTSDFSDCFSHSFTTSLLILFTAITSVRNYFGQTITCWLPNEFTKAQQDYVEQVCWINYTYFVPTQAEIIPINPSDKQKAQIGYYQWMPFIFVMQAFCFSFPKMIWMLFQWQSGVHLPSILSVSCDLPAIRDAELYKRNVKYIAKHIEDSIRSNLKAGQGHVCKRFFNFWCGNRGGNYLVSLYIIVKFLYIANVISQLFLMNKYMESKYKFYGFGLLKDLVSGITWEESGSFPRITWCDFVIRRVGHQKHTHSTQCVLPVNMFNEKIYIFLWFWYTLVAIISIGSFITWSWRATFRRNRIRFIRKHLKLRDAIRNSEKSLSNAFVDHFLRQDAIFILRLISHNASDLICSQVVEQLWCFYKDKPHTLSVASHLTKERTQSVASSAAPLPVPGSSSKDDLVKYRNIQRQNAALSDPGETI